MMNESIIYGLIMGAFSLIDLFQHNSYHVALKNPTHNLFQAHSRIEPVISLGIWSVFYRSEYVVVYMVIGLLEHDLIWGEFLMR